MPRARLSASAAHRWMRCPGSVGLCATLPEQTSPYAEEGTQAHAIAARRLWGESVPAPSKEMDDAISIYVAFCEGGKVNEDHTAIEINLDNGLKKLDRDCGGTLDFSRFNVKSGHLRIVDLKYGQGVVVDPEENEQLLFYALGVILGMPQYTVRSLSLVIVQPRVEGVEPIREWYVPAVRLFEFMEEVRAAAQLTRTSSVLVAGEKQCRFCPARGICPELERKQHAVVAADFTVTAVDVDRLQAALDAIPFVEARIKSLRETAYNRLAMGLPVPGYKLVAKRGTRAWKDEAEAKKELAQFGEAVYDPATLKSPAQAEKVIGKSLFKKFAALCPAVSSGYTLAAESDERPAQTLISANDFPAIAVEG